MSAEDIWTAQFHRTTFASSTRINGWVSANDAMSIAGDVALGMAPEALIGFMVGAEAYISGRMYLEKLEGGNPKAHALSKHGPDASDDYLMNQAKNSRYNQTKFTDIDEMAALAMDVAESNKMQISAKASSGKGGLFPLPGGQACFSGFEAQTAYPISGISTSSTFVF